MTDQQKQELFRIVRQYLATLGFTPEEYKKKLEGFARYIGTRK